MLQNLVTLSENTYFCEVFTSDSCAFTREVANYKKSRVWAAQQCTSTAQKTRRAAVHNFTVHTTSPWPLLSQLAGPGGGGVYLLELGVTTVLFYNVFSHMGINMANAPKLNL